MVDCTHMAAYVYDCPDGQQAAAADALDGLDPPDDIPPRWQILDTTLNAAREPIGPGEDPCVVRVFTGREDAYKTLGELQAAYPDGATRYEIERVTGLDLKHGYVCNEMPVGTATITAAALRSAAPGCSFVLWEDPKYEYLGTACAYAPDLGPFEANCDSDGTPVFSLGEVMSLLNQAREEHLAPEHLPEFMRLHLGGPWYDRWHAAGTPE